MIWSTYRIIWPVRGKGDVRRHPWNGPDIDGMKVITSEGCTSGATGLDHPPSGPKHSNGTISLGSTMDPKGILGDLSILDESLDYKSLMVEAFRDIMKDEIKRKIRDALDANPELRARLKEYIEDLVDAKVRETFASIRIAKTLGDVSLAVLPDKYKNEFSKELVDMFEDEISEILQKMI